MQFPEIIFVTKALRRPTQNRDEMILPHKHNNAEFVLYTKGCGTTTIDGIEYCFNEGSIAMINPDTIHSEVHYVAGEVIYFNITDIGAEFIANGVYRPSNFSVLKKIAMDIYCENRAPKCNFKMLLSAKVGEFLALMSRELVSTKFNTTDIHYAKSYLKNNCCERINMQTVATMYGVGYESFRHKFKKICGMSPLEYLIYYRLLYACDLLTDTQKSCTEIAMECNFSDSAQFSKMFKKRFGIAPTTYRKKINSTSF